MLIQLERITMKASRSKKKTRDNPKWLKPRSIRFDVNKLKKARAHGVINELSDRCREQLDLLIKDLP